MDAVEKRNLPNRELAFRCASLHVDRAFKDVIAVMKADVLQKWANEKDAAKRNELWHQLQAVESVAGTVAKLAADAEITKRKEAADKLKADRRPRS